MPPLVSCHGTHCPTHQIPSPPDQTHPIPSAPTITARPPCPRRRRRGPPPGCRPGQAPPSLRSSCPPAAMAPLADLACQPPLRLPPCLHAPAVGDGPNSSGGRRWRWRASSKAPASRLCGARCKEARRMRRCWSPSRPPATSWTTSDSRAAGQPPIRELLPETTPSRCHRKPTQPAAAR